MSELARRSGGMWRPSPGSIYPVLQQLQDEGLVSLAEDSGRRVFSLTDAGRQYVDEHADEIGTPWGHEDQETVDRVSALHESLGALGAAVHQVARIADTDQTERARRKLDQARQAMYLILAEEKSETPTEPTATSDPNSDDSLGTDPDA